MHSAAAAPSRHYKNVAIPVACRCVKQRRAVQVDVIMHSSGVQLGVNMSRQMCRPPSPCAADAAGGGGGGCSTAQCSMWHSWRQWDSLRALDRHTARVARSDGFLTLQ